MKKLLLAVFLSGVTIVATANSKQESGTLLDETMHEWCEAAYGEKLSAIESFVLRSYKEQQFNSKVIERLDSTGKEGIRHLSEELIKGLDVTACESKSDVDPARGVKVINMLDNLILLLSNS